MIDDKLKKHFETLFGQAYEHGRHQAFNLIQRAMKMGRFAEGERINWGGKTTVNDRDFLKLAFFAMIGAGFVDEILGAPQIEASAQDTDNTDVDNSADYAGEYTDPRTDGLEPYRDLDVRHRGGPRDVADVAMSNDPCRPEQLYRCGACTKDMERNGDRFMCINPNCPDYHEAIEIEIEIGAADA